eukprot:m.70118 g.70118  ORF g.70118 m.70118 type:complete len:101 (+) comp12108_c0_seq3:635-937(+)
MMACKSSSMMVGFTEDAYVPNPVVVRNEVFDVGDKELDTLNKLYESSSAPPKHDYEYQDRGPVRKHEYEYQDKYAISKHEYEYQDQVRVDKEVSDHESNV